MNNEIAEKVEAIVAELQRRGGTCKQHLIALAEHYRVEPKDLQEMLLSRQVIAVWVMTIPNFDKPATRKDLVQVLSTLHRQEEQKLMKITAISQRVTDAIDEAERLREKAIRLIHKIRISAAEEL